MNEMLNINKRGFNSNLTKNTREMKTTQAINILKEDRLKAVMRELDQECTVVYKAGQRGEFTRINKIYNRLREYKVLMDTMSAPTTMKLLEDLALEYYRVVRPELIKED